MRNESRFFTVFPSVVLAGEKAEVTITAIHDKMQFDSHKYTLKIVPKEKRDLPKDPNLKILGNSFNTQPVEVNENKITFSYLFSDEQEYRLILMDENNVKKYDFAIYALNADLFETMPHRGDLHMHTTCSDGLGTIAQLMSAYREMGLDFVCITDHHKYSPSVEAIKMFEGADTGLTIFPGEEVHNCHMGYIHIVNFGGKYSINEMIEEDYEGLCKTLREEAKKVEVPEGIDAFDYVMRKWICDEIRKSGGKAIFPHPYWTIRDEYHVETDFSIYTLKQGIYDIFEVYGGCSAYENQMQASLWQELRLQGIDMPIVGSTDTHDYQKKSTSSFGQYGTLVFAKDNEDIKDAIMDRRSVAIETIENETPHVTGSFRLLKYAIFLLENFYPIYETYTRDLGALMRSYAENGDCSDAISSVNKKAQEYRRKFFNKK